MQSPEASGPGDLAADGRPATLLPLGQLFQDLDLLVRHQRDLGRRRRRGPPERSRAWSPEDQVGRTLFALIKVAASRSSPIDRPADGRHDQRLHHEPLGAAQAVHRRRCILDVLFLHRDRVQRRRSLAVDGVRRPAAVQLELRAGAVPGLHPRPRRREAGRASPVRSSGSCQILGNVGGIDHRLAGLRREPPDFTIPASSPSGLVEFADDGRHGRLGPRGPQGASDRDGRSWRSVAARGVGDGHPARAQLRLAGRPRASFFLTAVSMITDPEPALTSSASMALGEKDKGNWVRSRPVWSSLSDRDHRLAGGQAVRPGRPQGRSSMRRAPSGRRGWPLLTVAPSLPMRRASGSPGRVGAGAFLAVDWALMTDIIPKASSGRYMGMSNVATASAGALALIDRRAGHRHRRGHGERSAATALGDRRRAVRRRCAPAPPGRRATARGCRRACRRGARRRGACDLAPGDRGPAARPSEAPVSPGRDPGGLRRRSAAGVRVAGGLSLGCGLPVGLSLGCGLPFGLLVACGLPVVPPECGLPVVPPECGLPVGLLSECGLPVVPSAWGFPVVPSACGLPVVPSECGSPVAPSSCGSPLSTLPPCGSAGMPRSFPGLWLSGATGPRNARRSLISRVAASLGYVAWMAEHDHEVAAARGDERRPAVGVRRDRRSWRRTPRGTRSARRRSRPRPRRPGRRCFLDPSVEPIEAGLPALGRVGRRRGWPTRWRV